MHRSAADAGILRRCVELDDEPWPEALLRRIGDAWKRYLALAFAALALAPSAAAATPPPLVAAGAYHACSGTSTELRCWGSNYAGELGDGSTSDGLSPVAVKNLPTPILEVAASYDRTCARTGAGVYCWGRQSKTNNGKWVSTPTPTKVSNVPSGAHGLSVGVKHACILDGSGKPWCWGTNGSGEVGDGTTTTRTKAVKTKFGTSAAIAASDGYTCVLLSAGGVSCIGVSHGGDNGDPLNPPGQVVNSKTTPQPIVGLATATAISTTGDFACALLAGGLVSCWGENDHLQLGDGTHTGRPVPVVVAGIPESSQVVATANHVCSLGVDGSVYCWGRGDHGQMGNGTTVDGNPSPVSQPRPASRLVGSASGHFTLAIADDGSAFAWGRNQNGALLTGDTTDRLIPTSVTLP